MICQDCGVEARTRYVSFHQNIGALIMRFSKSIQGRLCKSCIHRYFWRMTSTTVLLGWWGIISLIVTPFFLLNNIGRYLLCLTMRGVPRGATAPTLTDEALERITPFAPAMLERLTRGENLATVATSTASHAAVTPGQIILFIQAIVRAQREKQARPGA